MIIRDSSPRSYRFDHLSGFGVLNSFGLVLLVGFWERWGDDCVQNAGCETVQEEADGFFAPDSVSCAADEFFEVCDVLIYFGEAHFAFIQIESRPLLLLQVREVLCELLDKRVPSQLYIICGWV
jgi:hypothetical protein